MDSNSNTTEQSQARPMRDNGFKQHAEPFIKFPRDKMDFWINPSITEGAKKLFALICQINDYEKLSRREIERRAHMSRTTVQRAELELVELNMIRVEIIGHIHASTRKTIHHIVNPDVWRLPDHDWYSKRYQSDDEKDETGTPCDTGTGTPCDTGTGTAAEYQSSSIKKERLKEPLKDTPQLPAPLSVDPEILESSLPALPKPKKYTYDDGDQHVAEEWARYARMQMPSVKVNAEAWANEVRLLRSQFGLGVEDMLGILKWVSQDSFWAPNAISLLGLRKPGSNGLRKIENILKRMPEFQRQVTRHRLDTGKFTLAKEEAFHSDLSQDDDDFINFITTQK